MAILKTSVGLIYTIGADTKDADAAIKKHSKTFDRELENVKSSFTSTQIAAQAFGGLAEGYMRDLAASIMDGAKALFDYSARMQQTTIGFQSLIGNAEKSNKLLADLKKFAESTPFQFEALLPIAQRLLAANVQIEKIIPLMKDLGNVTAATGNTSAERLEGIGVALTQIISKGKVSAEEMEQLAERGIPAWNILSQAIGKSVAATRKMAEDGKINSNVIIEALRKVSQEKYGDAMEKQSKTFSGAWNKIKDEVFQDGSDFFKPVFDAVSQFTVKFGENLLSQENKGKEISEKFGFSLGQAIGEGIKKGATKENYLSYLRYTVDAGVSNFGMNFGRGVAKSLTEKPQSSIADLRKYDDRIVTSIADIRRLDDTIKAVNQTVEKTPSLADELQAERAEKEAEKLKKIVDDLTSRIAFYGQESEVASVKQKLIAEGITDFNSEAVKSALSLASTIDKLKKAKEAQKEYNDKIKDWRKELDSFAEKAFSSMFPQQSELDRFNKWVRTTKADMSDLKKEVLLTKTFLEQVAEFKKLLDNQDRFDEFDKSITGAIQNVALSSENLSSLKQVLIDVANAAKLAATEVNLLGKISNEETIGGQDQTQNVFVEKLNTFLENYRKATEKFNKEMAEINRKKNPPNDSTLLNNKSEISDDTAFALNILDDVTISEYKSKIEKMRNELVEFLRTLKTFKEEDGKIIELPRFSSDSEIDVFIQKMVLLNKTVNDAALKSGLEKIDTFFSTLSQTLSGDELNKKLKEIDDLFKDPTVAQALEDRAAALGKTVEQLKELLKLQIQGAPPAAGQIKEGDDEEAKPEGGLLDGFFDGFIEQAEEFVGAANIVAGMADILKDAFDNVADAIGNAVSEWVLYGSTGTAVMKKVLATTLASIAAEAAVRAIYATALGFLRLAQWDFAAAGNAFASAGAWAALAGGAALAGRAIAGDSFKKENSSSISEGVKSNQEMERNGATAYSGFGDKMTTVENDRNKSSESTTRVQIGLEKGLIAKIIREDVRDNGPIRQTFIEVQQGA